jgi:hypothetical protein
MTRTRTRKTSTPPWASHACCRRTGCPAPRAAATRAARRHPGLLCVRLPAAWPVSTAAAPRTCPARAPPASAARSARRRWRWRIAAAAGRCQASPGISRRWERERPEEEEGCRLFLAPRTAPLGRYPWPAGSWSLHAYYFLAG